MSSQPPSNGPIHEAGVPQRKLLVGVFLNQQGTIEVAWGDGVKPIKMMCKAIDLLHEQYMAQRQSPILRAAGPIPRTG